MICRYCGQEIEEGARFCRHCGVDLSKEQDTVEAVVTPQELEEVKKPKKLLFIFGIAFFTIALALGVYTIIVATSTFGDITNPGFVLVLTFLFPIIAAFFIPFVLCSLGSLLCFVFARQSSKKGIRIASIIGLVLTAVLMFTVLLCIFVPVLFIKGE